MTFANEKFIVLGEGARRLSTEHVRLICEETSRTLRCDILMSWDEQAALWGGRSVRQSFGQYVTKDLFDEAETNPIRVIGLILTDQKVSNRLAPAPAPAKKEAASVAPDLRKSWKIAGDGKRYSVEGGFELPNGAVRISLRAALKIGGLLDRYTMEQLTRHVGTHGRACGEPMSFFRFAVKRENGLVDEALMVQHNITGHIGVRYWLK